MGWKSNVGLIRKATAVRVYNAILVFLSFYWSRILRRPKMFGSPIAASIEPTTACNLRCPQCPSGLRSFTRDTGKVKMDLYKKAIDQLGKKLWYLTLYFQGEPYLHPQFTDLVKYANEKNIYTATSTNAHFLNDKNAEATVRSGLDKIIISVDGLTQETYEKYRIEGRLTKVEEGMDNLKKWKRELNSSTPHIIVQFIVMRHNEHQVKEVKSWARKHGADELQLKTAQIYDYEKGSDILPINSGMGRYEQDEENGDYKIRNRLFNHCWRLWHSFVMTWDGNVVPCCFDKDAKYVMGNLEESAFNDIWKHKVYDDFRSQLLLNRRQIDICNNCTEGTKVYI